MLPMRLILLMGLFLAEYKTEAQKGVNARKVEAGVSEQLAQYRKQILSQINCK
jgi:hypothetical protein